MDGEQLAQKAEWITWAKDKADWYDPIVAKDDLVLGKRRHTEDEEHIK